MKNKENPIDILIKWLDEAQAHSAIAEPTAMCLATADAQGRPSARMVLLKGIDARGIVFYTNMESRKSLELAKNPQAALCFYWMPMNRQVRIEGRVVRAKDAEADAYFMSRPRESQLGAWASDQSRPLESREAMMERFEKVSQQYEGGIIPRPEYWGGWRLNPERIEFWQQGDHRLHNRLLYIREGKGWKEERLWP